MDKDRVGQNRVGEFSKQVKAAMEQRAMQNAEREERITKLMVNSINALAVCLLLAVILVCATTLIAVAMIY
jgi:energy-coupling factor transporter transmembrane protein EcfT